MQLRLTKEFSFQMAHALTGYDGKCRNLHGHNYRLLVSVEGSPIDDLDNAKNGMVVDFGDIKKIVERQIIDVYDHALVVTANSVFADIHETKLIVTDFQPTCEKLLLDFAKRLDGSFPSGIRLAALRLYETDSSFAELFL